MGDFLKSSFVRDWQTKDDLIDQVHKAEKKTLQTQLSTQSGSTPLHLSHTHAHTLEQQHWCEQKVMSGVLFT